MSYSIIYLSSASSLLDSKGVEAIMKISLSNNNAMNISGFLLYKEGTFLQLLEGKENVVKETYDRVRADTRHKNIIPVMHQSTSKRAFEDYHSGFKACADPSLIAELKAYINSIKDFEDRNIKKTIHLVEGILRSM